ncbi:hypothetical protein LZ318_37645 [Saccharopolyspora indica]|nr:hypothetical protein [Saccharopolyspora indica]MDA3642919.1 hypothetical protein [Saccharopolyspora indica]
MSLPHFPRIRRVLNGVWRTGPSSGVPGREPDPLLHTGPRIPPDTLKRRR